MTKVIRQFRRDDLRKSLKELYPQIQSYEVMLEMASYITVSEFNTIRNQLMLANFLQTVVFPLYFHKKVDCS